MNDITRLYIYFEGALLLRENFAIQIHFEQYLDTFIYLYTHTIRTTECNAENVRLALRNRPM